MIQDVASSYRNILIFFNSIALTLQNRCAIIELEQGFYNIYDKKMICPSLFLETNPSERMCMSTTDQFLPGLQSYQEILSNLHQGEAPFPVPDRFIAYKMLAGQVATLSGGSLMIGLAEDGLPLLLDLYNPTPGPLLIAGDGGSGKTAFLKALARASNIQNPGEIQFGVVTPFPEEWKAHEVLPNCMGIWPAYHSASRAFLSQLISWGDILSKSRQAVLVFFDGLELLTPVGSQIRYDLRWLLLYGPERHIWPVVTVNPGRLPRLETSLEPFQTRILGQVKCHQTARLLMNDPHISLAGLVPGRQFGLSRPGSLVKFWLPPIG